MLDTGSFWVLPGWPVLIAAQRCCINPVRDSCWATQGTNCFCLGCVWLLAFSGLGVGKCCGCVLLLWLSWSVCRQAEIQLNPGAEVNLITEVYINLSDKCAVHLTVFLLDPNEVFFLWTVICFRYSKYPHSTWKHKQELMPACFSYILVG